jgi:hypothetical protein
VDQWRSLISSSPQLTVEEYLVGKTLIAHETGSFASRDQFASVPRTLEEEERVQNDHSAISFAPSSNHRSAIKASDFVVDRQCSSISF